MSTAPLLNSLLSMTAVFSSALFLLSSASLQDRYHYLLFKNGETKITKLPSCPFKFYAGYLSDNTKLPVNFSVKTVVDTSGDRKKIILEKRIFTYSIGVLASIYQSSIYEKNEGRILIGKHLYITGRMDLKNFIPYAVGLGGYYIFPLWEGDTLTSLQFQSGIIVNKKIGSSDIFFSLPSIFNYRLTRVLTLELGPELNYSNKEKAFHINFNLLTGFLF